MDYSSVHEAEKQMQNLFKNINELQQQNDQSRQQALSPVFCDSSLRPNNQTFSQSSIHSLNSIQKSTKKETVDEVDELKLINRKLFEDNKTLLKECVRLRRISKSNSQIQAPKESLNKARELQLQNLHYINEINKIRTENLKLKAQLYSLDHYEDSKFHSNFNKQILSLSEKCEFLHNKIDDLGKRQIWRKNSSFYNSTEESKSFEKQKFKIKQNYETQIYTLKKNLQEKDHEISRLKRASEFGRRPNQSPTIKRPSYLKYVQKK